MLGKIILDLPPKKNNPRNSEGAFLKLADGTIMFAYSRFRGNHGGDDMDADIVALYSNDNGETFGASKVLFTKEELDAKNIMSVSMLRIDEDTIAVFYMVRMGFHDLRAVIRLSKDEGRTFAAAKYCINYPGYFVVNNDRIIRLSNGRILIPAAYHRCIGPDPIAWESFNGKGVARFFYSDDIGKTFHESPEFGALNVPTKTGLQEPGIIELDDGHLYCYCRTDLGFQYESHSYDFGMSWEPFVQSQFASPISPLSIKKVPGKNIFVAVYNPKTAPDDRPSYTWGRTPLILRTSDDNCKTFKESIILDDDPESGYCYTALHFTDDALLLAYCAGGQNDGCCLNRLRIRKIMYSEIRI